MSRCDVPEDPDPGPPAWCQGCGHIGGSNFFLWTDDYRYVCGDCWKVDVVTRDKERMRWGPMPKPAHLRRRLSHAE